MLFSTISKLEDIMQTQCFAKWHEDDRGNAYRDGTILQYGEGWGLLGNVILLNPGSANPQNDTPANDYLKEQYSHFADNGEYYPFSVDPLMRSLVALFKQRYPEGGVLRICNLFNLKNPDSGTALKTFPKVEENKHMMTPMESMDFHDGPVIVATGGSVHAHPKLEEQLRRYIAKTPADMLYAIVRRDDTTFAVEKAMPDTNGLVESYHPSYTCKYGNSTIWAE